MRIGMNLIPLRPGQMGGAEVYFRDLLAELLKRGQHEYVLVTADYNHDTLPADSAMCRRVLFGREAAGAAAPLQGVAGMLHGGLAGLRQEYMRLVPAVARAMFRPLWRPGVRAGHMMSRGIDRLRSRGRRRRSDSLRELIKDEGIDIWFCPFTNLDPRVCPVPAVITVYDLQHDDLPEFFDAAELRHRQQFYPESCIAADHVIAISEFTRQGVIEHYGVEPSRVSAISLAAGSDFGWRDAGTRVADVRKRYALPPRYVLYPANTWRHKNHARLIEALAKYRDETGEVLALVLTGVGKEGEVELKGAVDRNGLASSVHLLGYVPRADLPALYAGAACLVFPSLFEGFGIPLVEAMLVGCPVAASNATSIPEVVGDAAILFEPLDPSDIARAIAAIVRDPTTAAELARRGRARVDRFSGSKTADLTIDLLESVCRDGLARARASGRDLIAVEGVFDDQWMGREAVLSLRGQALVSLEIVGALAALGPIVPQRLRVETNGRESLDLSLTAPGPFSLTVPLAPNGTAAAGGWEVVLLAERTFRPRDHGLSADNRDLGVQIMSVRVKTRDGQHITKTLGAPPGLESAS
jgi:glycosyltransferase involved in cell wall biosynthesis